MSLRTALLTAAGAVVLMTASCSSSSSGSGGKPSGVKAKPTKYEKLYTHLKAKDSAYWSTYNLAKVSAISDSVCQDLANGGNRGIMIVTQGLGTSLATQKSISATALFLRQAALDVCPQFSNP